jgi:hypothetical protein
VPAPAAAAGHATGLLAHRDSKTYPRQGENEIWSHLALYSRTHTRIL